MGDIRKKHPPAFKIRVAAEAICGNATLAQLSSKYSVHNTMISKWKIEAVDAMTAHFSKTGSSFKKQEDADWERLHALLGKKEVELEFLKKKLGMLGTSRGKS
jgi:transposase